MRTVDPAIWSKKAKGRQISLAWPHRFGQARRGFEARVRDSFRDAAREFCHNCSFGGIRRAAGEDVPKIERCRWIMLLPVCLVAGAAAMSLNLMDLAEKPPLTISLQSPQHSIKVLPFPAIALCSYNVISRKTMEKYARMVAESATNRSYTLATIRKNLLDAGALVTLAQLDVDLQFAHFLHTVFKEYEYNVTELMYGLAPTCESLLERCSWAGQVKSCKRLFAMRITSVGFCCVFNGRYEDVDRHTPPKTLDRVGMHNGLSVILRENSDDFAYIRKPIDGIEVLVFDGTEYPFLEGGAVRVQVAPRNASVYYTVSTRAQLASPDLKRASQDWVGCQVGDYDGHYSQRSYSWCLLKCRQYTSNQLCGCVPYTLQPRHEQVCTLNELACLNKHREKFLSYHPSGEHLAAEALSEELQDALSCPECSVDCARLTYSVKKAYVQYQKREIFRNQFANGVDFTNVSILWFFYSTEDQPLYTVEFSAKWYEVFAYLGSQWVAVLGISVVTGFEVVFHCSLRWWHHYRRRTRLRAD